MYRWVFHIFCWIVLSSRAWGQDTPEMFYIRGENFRKSNNFIAALDEYDKALNADPNNPKYNFARGICYFKLKDYENAIKDLEKSLKGKPDNVAAYIAIAQSYNGM
ncbi:MAG: tetratricopeptide repeat protein [Flammeovirgaceae bacterium]|nr:tetratricopeptide repeat protein [Flammeovirgaceae bacterium]